MEGSNSDENEKHTRPSDVEVSSTRPSQTLDSKDGKDLDKAYIYLTHQNNVGDETVDIKALRRKIDWRIVPIMFLCYTMQFIDKVNVNVSLIQLQSKE
jgi:hypothetical protein